jgi:hypothetical protein
MRPPCPAPASPQSCAAAGASRGRTWDRPVRRLGEAQSREQRAQNVVPSSQDVIDELRLRASIGLLILLAVLVGLDDVLGVDHEIFLIRYVTPGSRPRLTSPDRNGDTP